MVYVYIAQCADQSLYTGWTDDPVSRIAAHNRGSGAKYTRSRRPVRLVYQEAMPSKSAALKREAAIKKLSRAEKLALIAGEKRLLPAAGQKVQNADKECGGNG